MNAEQMIGKLIESSSSNRKALVAITIKIDKNLEDALSNLSKLKRSMDSSGGQRVAGITRIVQEALVKIDNLTRELDR